MKPTRFNSTLALFSTLVALTGCASQGAIEAPTMVAPIAQTPIELAYNGRPVVQLFVNGKGPYPFVVDTASTTTAIFQNLAKDLGLQTEPNQSARVFSLAGVESHPIATLERVDIGNLTFESVEVVIFEDWESLPDTPGGILGSDVLSNFFLLIDNQSRMMSLYDAETPPSQLVRYWNQSTITTDNFGFDGGVLYLLEATTTGRSFPLIVDTGAETSIGNFAFLNQLPTMPPTPLSKRGTQVTDVADNETVTYLLNVPSMRTGEIRWRNITFFVSRARIFEELGYKDKPMALVGFDTLGERSFAIDFANSIFYGAPPIRQDKEGTAPSSP